MKKLSIKNILAPIDFSSVSIEGLETAKRLARSFGARVHLAHVSVPVQGRPLMAAAMAWQETPGALAKAVREGLSSQLKELASKYRLPNGDNVHLREGVPVFDVISRLAAEIPADLLVVQPHGFKGVKRFFLGSTAERLIQHSPCPILVDRRSAARLPSKPLPPGPSLRVERILVPVDFSSLSRDGLRYAIQFARHFAAKITVLHVLDLGYSEPKDWSTMEHPKGFAGASVRNVLNKARQEMRKFAGSVAFGRVRAHSEITIGSPVEQISDYALANDFDLIITSTHGLTGFKHVLIGSTAERLVRRSRVPILVVPSHPNVRAANLAGSRRQRSPLSQRK
jgi:nucleotide-binding universal stress UspA family protein